MDVDISETDIKNLQELVNFDFQLNNSDNLQKILDKKNNPTDKEDEKVSIKSNQEEGYTSSNDTLSQGGNLGNDFKIFHDT
jgi:hypothetical protein